jgi:hypothetical protein
MYFRRPAPPMLKEKIGAGSFAVATGHDNFGRVVI